MGRALSRDRGGAAPVLLDVIEVTRWRKAFVKGGPDRSLRLSVNGVDCGQSATQLCNHNHGAALGRYAGSGPPPNSFANAT